MNEFSLKNKIFERAFALGFSACGITPVKEVDADCRLHFDKWLQKGKEARMQYMRNYKDKRFDPRLLVENARSVLVVALNYYPSIHIPENHPQFALYSYGQDYHIVLKEKLNELLHFLSAKKYSEMPDKQNRVLDYGALKINAEYRSVESNGELVQLTNYEFEILYHPACCLGLLLLSLGCFRAIY